MERGGSNHNRGGGNSNGGGTDKVARGLPTCGGKRRGGLEMMPRRGDEDPLQDTQEFRLRGACRGNNDAGIQTLFIVKNIIRC
jgi:hypothetical protein